MSVRPYLSLIALAGALLGAGAAAGAQTSTYPLPAAPGASGQPGPGGQFAHHKNRMRAMLEQLNLSPDQRAKVTSMFQSFRASKKSATPMTRKELRSNIEAVLTGDQRTKLHAMMRQARRARMQASPPPAAS